jgi:hypothetical protein
MNHYAKTGKVQSQTISWADTSKKKLYSKFLERERESSSISEAHCFADFEAYVRERSVVLLKFHTSSLFPFLLLLGLSLLFKIKPSL